MNPLACRYHSFTEFRVDFLDRSNMNRIATASLHTRGNIFTNSRCPPRSQRENVMDVRRTVMVFSMKLTPVRRERRRFIVMIVAKLCVVGDAKVHAHANGEEDAMGEHRRPMSRDGI